MNKRKIAALIASVLIINFSAPSVEVLADEVSKKVTAIVETKSTKATISKFELLNNSNIGSYDKVFKMDNSNIESITNNGGNYFDSTLDKSLDGNFNTHWETGNPNNSEFTNEVVFKLKKETTLNRIVYAARQSSAKGKGFAKELEIYGSLTDDGDDFRLVCSGEYAGSTGDTVEIKFDNTKFKRIKFKFTKANENWASASEFMFYKEDKVSDKMKNLFTDATMSKVSAEFNSVEKINALDEEAKSHPLYSDFKEYIENAKLIVENKKINYTDANVSKFKDMNSEVLPKYDAIYKVPASKVKSITTNGGQYASKAITKAMDGDINTKWHSGKQNSTSFTNEVIIELNELTKLNRVVYTAPRGSKRGFAEQFDIYASRTTKGDTFELVSSGSSKVTQDSIEIRFNPTEFRRVKFVFKKGYEDWACAAEFGLYTQDKVAEKMNRLFTDSTMGTVSEEFNTIEKIKALEEEAKNHPFYEDYKEDIENAITILNSSEIIYTDAKIKSFNVYTETLKKYESLFKVPSDKINKISNNGGRYSNLVIENAIDGDINTRWHSGKQNTDTFKNEVIIELKETMKLNRILFKASIGTNRGFPEKFEIYASNTSKGDNFKLVSKGATSPTQDTLEFKFNPTEFKRIKFVYAKGYEDWATASEISLYKEDKLNDKVESLFKDTLMTKVSDEYNTIEKLDGLAEEVKGHPLENELMTIINLAKKIVNEPGKAEASVWELESRGNSIKESQKRKVWNFQDWQPTGYAAKSGEVINVYVDVEDGKPTPQLVFKQMDSQHNGQVVINLNKGRNVITVPELPTEQLRPGTAKAGVFYTSNPYTPEEQGRKPKIRIEGARTYPHYIKGVHTDEEVMKNLEKYVELLNEDPSLPDVFDVFSDKTLVNVKATYALDWFKKNNKLPSETANKSDEVIKETMKFWGFDGSSEVNSDFNFRYITMVKWLDNGGFMNAGNGITGFNKAEQGAVLDVNTGWGLMHEMGHNFDTNNRSIGEVTNNILPLHFERLKGEASKITKQNLWEKNILPKVALEDYSNNEYYPESDTTLLSHIAPLWQLQLYDETFWPKFEQEFRSKNIGGGNWDNKHNAWVKVASDVLKLDLSEHFARHGMDVWEETKEYTSKYPKPSKKLWYANDRMYLNKGGVFTDDVKYEANAKIVNDNEVVLNFSIDEANKNNVIGYEIFRDGEAIGFTSTNSFTDRKAATGKNHNYTVVAYDNELNASKPYDLNLHAPTINVESNVILALNESFNPLDYVKAYNYEGNDISNKIKIVKNDVNTSKKGSYDVTYQVTDEGDTKTKKLKVQVVSEYDYLSDFEWNSAETQWGTPRRNTNIKGRVNEEVKEFEKGFGIHANGKIIYSLEGKEYDRFVAQVGVDAGIAAQNNSSITFNIIGDGKTLASTSVLKHADNLVGIDVPVSGVKELVIEVTDSGNGNTSDHAVIANPKLTTNNAKPRITANDKVYKIGDTVDFKEGVSARDAEDGDITSKVEVTGKVNFNKTGKYKITYKVIDSDGNEVIKTRIISVVDMKDYRYLTEYDWKSANSGWKTVNKDKSVDNNKLTLTDEEGQAISYDRGIGTHATSTIIYDLSDKDYEYFSSYVGVDREMYGSVGSISFEVYVDGEKKFDSGIMNSRDPQKYVEVDINGAKELKLVVKDGGNGNGSDHATWGDAKLHFANDIKGNYEELESLVKEAKNYEKDKYTEESFKVLEEALNKAEVMLEDKISNQDEINSMIKELNKAISNLENNVDLNEVITIKDKYLKDVIKKELNLSSDNITIGDMYKLTKLSCSNKWISSLEGLEYAKNLESLDISYNEIKDLSPLKNLKKLTNLNANLQIITEGMLYAKDNKITLDYKVLNRNGEKLKPKQIVIKSNRSDEAMDLSLDQLVDENGVISFDISNFDKYLHSIYLVYEDEKDNFLTQSLYMFDAR
ncbi:NPCBM/NEW2 domain-containing protein [Clostridium baratii]